jgi:ribosomal protein S18 acetylase RimI-like enzyme
MAIEYRPCELSDTPAVLEFWRRAGAIARPTDDAEGLAARLERDADLFLLALAEGTVIGTLMGGWDGWRGNMYRLVVDPRHRRKGVAKELVDRVEEALCRRGARRITSLVFHDEPGAADFWRSAGYEPDAAVTRYAKDLPG